VRVVLLEGGNRILPSVPESLSRKATRDLQKLGVEVRTGARVTSIDQDGVSIGSERIEAHSVFWAAGNLVSPLTRSLGAPIDQSGHVLVEPDLSLPGDPRVFVVGDAAAVKRANGAWVPGVAPAANQMGERAAKNIRALMRGKPTKPFVYVNKGELATIGRHKAIASFLDGKLRISGYAAWYFWLLLHIAYLIGFRNRLSVMLQWAYNYIWFERGVRLISDAEDLA
jgi:NADH dehydrogenase